MIRERIARLERGEEVYGNCFVFVAAKLAASGGAFEVVRSSHPLLPRFVHIGDNGVRSVWHPVHPRSDWLAGLHAFWHLGEVREYATQAMMDD